MTRHRRLATAPSELPCRGSANPIERPIMDFGAHSIIWIILVGLVIGAIAKLLMPGKDPGGCIITILLASQARWLALWLGTHFSGRRITSPVGSCRSRRMILLLLYRLVFKRRP